MPRRLGHFRSRGTRRSTRLHFVYNRLHSFLRFCVSFTDSFTSFLFVARSFRFSSRKSPSRTRSAARTSSPTRSDTSRASPDVASTVSTNRRASPSSEGRVADSRRGSQFYDSCATAGRRRTRRSVDQSSSMPVKSMPRPRTAPRNRSADRNKASSDGDGACVIDFARCATNQTSRLCDVNSRHASV